ncbi:MAG TPA: DUF5666 domain-containing protein [Nitrospira sp.]|nr:DUF5666 domain-containing protein [Nitrospira sp.]
MRQANSPNFLGGMVLFVVLASCGPTPQAGGGIGGTGSIASIVASGPITGFGSIFVSGTEYDTMHTSMTIDGNPGNQSDLKKGMIVRVNATVPEGSGTDEPVLRTANAVLYEDTVEGFVQSIAADGTGLIVLGQTVTITPATAIDVSIQGGNVANLMPGRDVVEISGFVMGDGRIRATWVELKRLDQKTDTPDYHIKGFIKHHRADQQTFEIGDLTLDYRDAVLNDMPGQSSDGWNGLLIDVAGNQTSTEGLGSSRIRLTATRVSQENLGLEEGEVADIEGFVTQALRAGEFFIGNVQVLADAGTTFQGGTLNEIRVGVHMEVHGSLVGGIVKATAVEFKP